jgi:hypothetical protein
MSVPELPTDYREFVQVYGGGEIDEYLSISTPHLPGSPYGDLLERVEPLLSAEDQAELVRRLPEVTSPLLLPFGATASSDVVFWLRERSPDVWKVVTFRRQSPHGESRWSNFGGGMVEFLVAALKGEISPFSENFSPAERHCYFSWRDGENF